MFRAILQFLILEKNLNKATHMLFVCGFGMVLGGCASLTGGGLIPGKSVAKDVEAAMGQPAEKISSPNGDSIWFYPRHQAGRQTIAVRIAPDGTVRSVEERLEPEYMAKVVAGVTTASQARELLGPPYRVTRLPLLQREVSDYLFYDGMGVKQVLSLQFSPDGIVREINVVRDPTEVSGAK